MELVEAPPVQTAVRKTRRVIPRLPGGLEDALGMPRPEAAQGIRCLLYTSDAADDLLCVDLGGRRLTKKKNISVTSNRTIYHKVNKTTYST